MRPDAHGDEPDTDRGRHHDGVAEDRFAREDGDDLGRKGEGGDHEHVDLGVAEDPEEVHPHDRRTARLRVEEVAAQVAVDEQHDLRRRERAHGQDHQDCHGETQPREQRHSSKGHPRAPHAQDGGQYVDGRPDAAEARHQERQRPVIRAVPGREGLGGQGCVCKPSHVRRVARPVEAAAAEEAEIKEKSAERRQPEAERVQPRERHVARADHQRYEVIGEPEHERHGHEEDHRGAMHREHPVEHLRRHEVGVRGNQLDPHDHRFDAPDHQEHQGIDDVQDPEALVVDGGDPLVQSLDERPRCHVGVRPGDRSGRHRRDSR